MRKEVIANKGGGGGLKMLFGSETFEKHGVSGISHSSISIELTQVFVQVLSSFTSFPLLLSRDTASIHLIKKSTTSHLCPSALSTSIVHISHHPSLAPSSRPSTPSIHIRHAISLRDEEIIQMLNAFR